MAAARFAGLLAWDELDPHRHPFDALGLEACVTEVLDGARERGVDRRPATSEAASRARDVAMHEVEGDLQRALITRWGAWIGGFCWSAPGDGGLVDGWCCANHSLALHDATETRASIARTIAAVHEWRETLVSLAARFDALETELAGLDVSRATERAAAALLPFVVERTRTSEAWYGTFASVLTWFLQHHGLDAFALRAHVANVVSGRFESWCAPNSTAARDACAELGLVVESLASTDALSEWLVARERVFAHARPLPEARPQVRRDGHLAYVASHDRPRDPARADRMTTALEATRRSALRGDVLTRASLTEWTSVALGAPAVLRTTDAFAKAGRERYAYRDDLFARFDDALSEASRASDGALVRAARVYLDVCFFHPFEDGNARAARLALDHVLTTSGLALHTAEPVFALARSADDAHGVWHLVSLLARLVGERS